VYNSFIQNLENKSKNYIDFYVTLRREIMYVGFKLSHTHENIES